MQEKDRDRATLAEKIASLEKRIRELEEEHSRRSGDVDKTLSDLEAELQKKNAALDESEKQRAGLGEKVKSLSDQLKEKEDELVRLKAAVAELEKKLSEALIAREEKQRKIEVRVEMHCEFYSSCFLVGTREAARRRTGSTGESTTDSEGACCSKGRS